MTQTVIEGVEAPPRPTVTDEMVREAAVKILTRARCSEDPDDLVVAYHPNMDGYELAKELDQHFGWDVDAALVETLDGMHWAVRELHEAACKQWVAEWNIQPPLPDGAEITRGFIHKVCPHSAACYQVKQHGCAQEGRFLIVKFEDATATAALSKSLPNTVTEVQ